MVNEKRMIDADLLIGGIEFAEKHICVGDSQFIEGYTACLRGVIKAVNEMPTVDAVEVVHARWESDLHHLDGQPYKDEWYGYIFKCSACGGTMMGDGDLVCRDNYCPRCGAKMDGDGNGNL